MEGHAMATFISLLNFTDQGIRNVKQTLERAQAFREMAGKAGVTVKDIYWTLGDYDVVVVADAPSDEAALSVLLGLGSLGNVRTRTLRAFSAEEMKPVVAKLP
jgi:uncharacterized protein with GYD domain